MEDISPNHSPSFSEASARHRTIHMNDGEEVILPRKRRRRYVSNNERSIQLAAELQETRDQIRLGSNQSSLERSSVSSGSISTPDIEQELDISDGPKLQAEIHGAGDDLLFTRSTDNSSRTRDIEDSPDSSHDGYRLTSSSLDFSTYSGGDAIVALGGKEIEKDAEARKFGELLMMLEMGRVSQNVCRKILRLEILQARNSYDSLMRYTNDMAGITKRYMVMCPLEHAAVPSGSLKNPPCLLETCSVKTSKQHRFWYKLVSEQLAALCREKSSFHELLSGCRRAKQALQESSSSTLFDYYDGDLFRPLYGNMMREFDEKSEIVVFLTMSTDGFQLFKGRKGSRSAWPIVFVILNLHSKYRYRAMNALVGGFVPASHAKEHFDSFLAPIVDDLLILEKGIDVLCYNGSVVKLRGFVLFVTSDWPAGSKVMGFVGHLGLQPCRMCWKKATKSDSGKTRYMTPSASLTIQRAASKGRHDKTRISWLEHECGERTTASQIRNIWRRLEDVRRRKRHGWKGAIKKITSETGVKFRTTVSRLSLEFPYSIPYDPMHQLLLGWVSLVIDLLLGQLEKNSLYNSPYVLNPTVVERVNRSLLNNIHGFPQAWGRPPESFEYKSNLKAEDYKNIGLFYGRIIFQGDGVDKRVTKLWVNLSKIIHIVLDPTPSRRDIDTLSSLLSIKHALYCEIFYVDACHDFCLTPNTHAVIHLSEMVRECGPLLNVSQFVIERFVGEVGSMVQSKRHPETSLFNKTHSLFSLRLLNAGMGLANIDEESAADELRDEDKFVYETKEDSISSRGRGNIITATTRSEQARQCIEGILIRCKDVAIIQIQEHKTARIGRHEHGFAVESRSHFESRKKNGLKARQKCWIAAHFIENENESDQPDQSEQDNSVGVYYGCIEEIWIAEFSFTDQESETFQKRRTALVKVNWLNGLSVSKKLSMVYTNIKNHRGRKGTLKDVQTTVEEMSCIARVIGFFDHANNRFFLDQERLNIEKEDSVSIRGIRSMQRC